MPIDACLIFDAKPNNSEVQGWVIPWVLLYFALSLSLEKEGSNNIIIPMARFHDDPSP